MHVAMKSNEIDIEFCTNKNYSKKKETIKEQNEQNNICFRCFL